MTAVWPQTPRLPNLNSRYIQFLLFACILSALGLFWVLGRKDAPDGKVQTDLSPHHLSLKHPIDVLVQNAENEYHRLLARRTSDVSGAARAYRERRGRHPPPGFAEWFAYAQKYDGVVVEEFWDRVYDDLNPFWGVEQTEIKRQLKSMEQRISVRNGNASFLTDEPRPWMDLWGGLVKTLEAHLPDLDMGINVMDETRLLVRWEEIDDFMKKEQLSRGMPGINAVVSSYTTRKPIEEEDFGEPFGAQWDRGPIEYWRLAYESCAPDSPARKAEVITNFTAPPPLHTKRPKNSYKGYVQNWTYVKDPCEWPDLQSTHGTFIEPISMSTSRQLLPMFGGSKLPMNNEILLPPAMYWAEDPMYSGGEGHGPPWQEKQDKVIWRGVASGGRHKQENWRGFQRHRMLSMLNSTSVSIAEEKSTDAAGGNFLLPEYKSYPLKASRRTGLAEWLSHFSDAAFTEFLCFPRTEDDRHCFYLDDYFRVKKGMPMMEMYKAKYLPDIDGNSFSGRYRGFLRSTSVPIKATIYAEWHDSRLIPWVHFVPMHNSFVDLYGILDYFLGYDGKGGHDDVAKSIAERGKSWAEQVLRKEDMQIYVYRLLLEWARICDERRERLGWVEDLR